MLNLKKTAAALCTTLMLLQGVSAINLNQDRAEAANWRPSIQGVMSRQYPIVAGNQFGSSRFDSTMNNWVAKHLDMVIINKAGDLFADYGPNGEIASQIHALNPNVKVLQYVNLLDVWQGQPSYYWLAKNQAYLRDDAGNPIYPYQKTSGTKRLAADSMKTIWQDYYANHAKRMTDGGMDGIFSDNWFRSNAQSWNINPTRFSQIMQGWETIGQKTKTAMGSGKILIGNSPAWSLYQARDMAMIESRNAPNASAFNKFLSESDWANTYGQATLHSIYWVFDNSIGYMSTYQSVRDFSLPANLLTDDIFAIPNDKTVFGFMEKVGKVGYPKGARYRANNIWHRDFTAGKVLFNDTAGTVTVNLPAGVYKDVYGSAKNSVTLESFRGIVLKGGATVSRPAAPSNLTVTNVMKGETTGNCYVYLSWKDNSNNETGFALQQSMSPNGPFQTIKAPVANSGSYALFLSKPPAGTYYYVIKAVNSAGESSPSNVVSAVIK